MSRNDNDDTYDTKFLHAFIKKILKSDMSIRWVAITDQDGNIINEQNREGVKLLLTKEENQESAINTIIRQKTRTKFEPKIGKLIYAFGRYQKLHRATIPINENYYLLITLDVKTKDFDNIIMEKIIPLVEKDRHKFVDDDADIKK
jgi:hypothetical protein